MTKPEKHLQDLFHETLRDIYYAEKKILTSLPKMAKAAQSPDLRAAFEKHERETEGQVERLEQIFALIEEPAKGKTCDAINGIIDESKEIMTEFKGSPALDAGLLASAQAVEHYEIARYGTLKTWADELGLAQAVKLLDETLQEEKKTDAALSELAKVAVNQEAIEVTAGCALRADPITTIDSPSAMSRNDWQRSAKWEPSMSHSLVSDWPSHGV